MDKRELKIDYFVCRNSVPACYEELSEKALAAAGKAYCIYSDFAVGAAVLLENGTIVLGNNQENVAYAKPGKECRHNIGYGRLYFMLVLLIRMFRSRHWLLQLVLKGVPEKRSFLLAGLAGR